MTTHEMCRISLRELPLCISRDSKTACDSIPQGEIIYIIHCTVNAVFKCHGGVTFICTPHSLLVFKHSLNTKTDYSHRLTEYDATEITTHTCQNNNLVFAYILRTLSDPDNALNTIILT